MIHLVTSLLGMRPDPALPVLLFFSYAFLGYIMECIVLTIEKKHLVINRGFVRHMPFCIIYGFGAMIGFALLRPFADNLVLLFVVGALGATVFEFAVAQLQIRIFGDFWWDYTKKPFNYKGILCLESTIGWGIIAILIVHVGHKFIVGLVHRIPAFIVTPLAVLLLAAYLLDFAFSARHAMIQKRQRDAAQANPVATVTDDITA